MCSGGAEGDRTPDLVIANDALSQLSYCPRPDGTVAENSGRVKRLGVEENQRSSFKPALLVLRFRRGTPFGAGFGTYQTTVSASRRRGAFRMLQDVARGVAARSAQIPRTALVKSAVKQAVNADGATRSVAGLGRNCHWHCKPGNLNGFQDDIPLSWSSMDQIYPTHLTGHRDRRSFSGISTKVPRADPQ